MQDSSRGGAAVEVSKTGAELANGRGAGIFHVVNSFEGPRRLARMLSQIQFWFCETDSGPKEVQLDRLKSGPLWPHVIVESRRGYHSYWRAANPSVENWKSVVRWGLVPFFGADPAATDPLRLLRAPGFWHLKDPVNPFLVKTVWEMPGTYTEQQMLTAFPSQAPARESRFAGPAQAKFWSEVASLHGVEALQKLSGHPACHGERFELVPTSNGNFNIVVVYPDGRRRPTGCFVWADGALGHVRDGATIAGWLRWYGHSWGAIARILREVFPELKGRQ